MAAPTMDAVVALCKRRGLIFPASEIYGGIANTYDYGHYGVLLKKNVTDAWWKAMIQERDDVVALDSAIIQHPRTWEASGHLAGFSDPLVQCLGKCKQRFREDHLREAQPVQRMAPIDQHHRIAGIAIQNLAVQRLGFDQPTLRMKGDGLVQQTGHLSAASAGAARSG